MERKSVDSDTSEMIVKRVSVPVGLEELMEGLAKEILLKKPEDLYLFAAKYFSQLLVLRDRGNYKVKTVKSAQSVIEPSRKWSSRNYSIRGTPRQQSTQVSVKSDSPRKSSIPKATQKVPSKKEVVEKSTDTKSDSLSLEGKKYLSSRSRNNIERPRNSHYREKSVSSSDKSRSIQPVPKQRKSLTKTEKSKSVSDDKTEVENRRDKSSGSKSSVIEGNNLTEKILKAGPITTSAVLSDASLDKNVSEENTLAELTSLEISHDKENIAKYDGSVITSDKENDKVETVGEDISNEFKRNVEILTELLDESAENSDSTRHKRSVGNGENKQDATETIESEVSIKDIDKDLEDSHISEGSALEEKEEEKQKLAETSAVDEIHDSGSEVSKHDQDSKDENDSVDHNSKELIEETTKIIKEDKELVDKEILSTEKELEKLIEEHGIVENFSENLSELQEKPDYQNDTQNEDSKKEDTKDEVDVCIKDVDNGSLIVKNEIEVKEEKPHGSIKGEKETKEIKLEDIKKVIDTIVSEGQEVVDKNQHISEIKVNESDTTTDINDEIAKTVDLVEEKIAHVDSTENPNQHLATDDKEKVLGQHSIDISITESENDKDFEREKLIVVDESIQRATRSFNRTQNSIEDPNLSLDDQDYIDKIEKSNEATVMRLDLLHRHSNNVSNDDLDSEKYPDLIHGRDITTESGYGSVLDEKDDAKEDRLTDILDDDKQYSFDSLSLNEPKSEEIAEQQRMLGSRSEDLHSSLSDSSNIGLESKSNISQEREDEIEKEIAKKILQHIEETSSKQDSDNSSKETNKEDNTLLISEKSDTSNFETVHENKKLTKIEQIEDISDKTENLPDGQDVITKNVVEEKISVDEIEKIKSEVEVERQAFDILDTTIGDGKEVIKDEIKFVTDVMKNEDLERRDLRSSVLPPGKENETASETMHTGELPDMLVVGDLKGKEESNETLDKKQIKMADTVSEKDKLIEEENNSHMTNERAVNSTTDTISEIVVQDSASKDVNVLLNNEDLEEKSVTSNIPNEQQNDPISQLMHSGELHDIVVSGEYSQKPLDENKHDVIEKGEEIVKENNKELVVDETIEKRSTSASDLERVKDNAQLSELLHTGELHDAVVVGSIESFDEVDNKLENETKLEKITETVTEEKELDDKKEVPLETTDKDHKGSVEIEETIEKSTTVSDVPNDEENVRPAELLHTGELHDTVVVGAVESLDEVDNKLENKEKLEKISEITEKDSSAEESEVGQVGETIQETQKLIVQESSMQHGKESLKNEDNISTSTTDPITDKEEEKMQPLDLMHSGEFHDSVMVDLYADSLKNEESSNEPSNEEQNKLEKTETEEFITGIEEVDNKETTEEEITKETVDQESTKKDDKELETETIETKSTNVTSGDENTQIPGLVHTGELHDAVIVGEHLDMKTGENSDEPAIEQVITEKTVSRKDNHSNDNDTTNEEAINATISALNAGVIGKVVKDYISTFINNEKVVTSSRDNILTSTPAPANEEEHRKNLIIGESRNNSNTGSNVLKRDVHSFDEYENIINTARNNLDLTRSNTIEVADRRSATTDMGNPEDDYRRISSQINNIYKPVNQEQHKHKFTTSKLNKVIAVLKIQSLWRGFLVRKNLNIFNTHFDAEDIARNGDPLTSRFRHFAEEDQTYKVNNSMKILDKVNGAVKNKEEKSLKEVEEPTVTAVKSSNNESIKQENQQEFLDSNQNITQETKNETNNTDTVQENKIMPNHIEPAQSSEGGEGDKGTSQEKEERPHSIESTDSAVTVIYNEDDNSANHKEHLIDLLLDNDAGSAISKQENLLSDYQNQLLEQISGKAEKETPTKDEAQSFCGTTKVCDPKYIDEKSLPEQVELLNARNESVSSPKDQLNDDKADLDTDKSHKVELVHEELDHNDIKNLNKSSDEVEKNLHEKAPSPTLLHSGELHDTPIPLTRLSSSNDETEAIDEAVRDKPKESLRNDSVAEGLHYTESSEKGTLITEGQKDTEKAHAKTDDFKNQAHTKPLSPIQDLQSQEGLKHTGELHDSVILSGIENLPSQNLKDTDEAKIRSTSPVKDLPREGLMHTGEHHDMVVIPGTIQESNEEDETEQEVKETVKAETILPSSAKPHGDLLHTGEFHDTVVIPGSEHLVENEKNIGEKSKTDDSENKTDTKPSIPVKDLPVQEGLMHSGEFHDMVVIPESVYVVPDDQKESDGNKEATKLEINSSKEDSQPLK